MVEYVSGSPLKAMLVKGRSASATDEAPSKARRSEASAEGVREARSNSPGARTLEEHHVSRDLGICG